MDSKLEKEKRFYRETARRLSSIPQALPSLSDMWEEGETGLPILVPVSEREGVSLTGWPVELPLTLRRGLLADGMQTLDVMQEGKRQPSQTEILTRWADNSAQHVRVHTQVDLAPFQVLKLQLTGIRATSPGGLRVEETETTFEVDTGAATFRIDRLGCRQITSAVRSGREFIAPEGHAACWAGLVRDARTGEMRNLLHARATRSRVHEQGESRVVILLEKELWHADESITFSTWLIFYKDQPWVRLYSWNERDDYCANPLVAEELAFHAEFAHNGSPVVLAESRFGALSEKKVISWEKCGGLSAQVVLPWLRELGIESNSNVTVNARDGRATVEWRPIHADSGGNSPMNSPCWVTRYWREAAVVLSDEELEPCLAAAVRNTLEFRGPEIRLPACLQPDLALQELFTIPAETRPIVQNMAAGQSATRLSASYPRDDINGQEWHNWESAYFFGFGWRNAHIHQAKAFGPRAMKCDGIRLLQYEEAMGDSACGRQVRLQARAWPVNIASERSRWGFGFDDIAYGGKTLPRWQYSAEVAHTVPQSSNVAYAGRLMFHLFEMWCRTGEPMLRRMFDLLYPRIFRMLAEFFHHEFDGDRIWVIIRDLVRLYQFTEDPRFLRDLQNLLARLPETMALDQWNINYQCRLWNNESYGLVHRLLKDERMRRFHEGQVTAYMNDAGEIAVDESLLLPMVKTLPADLRWGLLGPQMLTAFAMWETWSSSPEVKAGYDHFWKVICSQLLAESKVWGGLHCRLYTESTCQSPTWFDRSAFRGTGSEKGLGWDTDYGETSQGPGEIFRGLTLHAAAHTPYRLSLSRQELVMWLDLKLPRYDVQWPGGRLAVSCEENLILEVEIQLSSGRCAIMLPGLYSLVDTDTSGVEILRDRTGDTGLSVLKMARAGSFRGFLEKQNIPNQTLEYVG